MTTTPKTSLTSTTITNMVTRWQQKQQQHNNYADDDRKMTRCGAFVSRKIKVFKFKICGFFSVKCFNFLTKKGLLMCCPLIRVIFNQYYNWFKCKKVDLSQSTSIIYFEKSKQKRVKVNIDERGVDEILQGVSLSVSHKRERENKSVKRSCLNISINGNDGRTNLNNYSQMKTR